MSRLSKVVPYALAILLHLPCSRAQEESNRPHDGVTSGSQQIIVRTQLLEIDRSKLRSVLRHLSAGKTSSRASSLAQISGFLDALRNNGIARILSETAIATLDGRPATLSNGSNVRIDRQSNVDDDHETQFVGTKLDVVPAILKNNRVRIRIRIDCSVLDESDNAGQSTEIPNICRTVIDTSFEANFGETIVNAGLVSCKQKAGQTEERELVLLVTPELADPKHENQNSTAVQCQAKRTSSVVKPKF